MIKKRAPPRSLFRRVLAKASDSVLVGGLRKKNRELRRQLKAHKEEICKTQKEIARLREESSTLRTENSVLREQHEKDVAQHQKDDAEKKKYKSLAMEDFVTKLDNRRGARKKLLHMASYCQREGRTMYVGVLDLDYLNKLNSALGHSGADAGLFKFAQAIKENMREIDTVARLGERSDEFLVAFFTQKNGNLGRLIKTAKKLGMALNTVYAGPKKDYKITASCGFAEVKIPPVHATKQENKRALRRAVQRTIKQADTATYAAKNEGGRNCIYYSTNSHNLLIFDGKNPPMTTVRMPMRRRTRHHHPSR